MTSEGDTGRQKSARAAVVRLNTAKTTGPPSRLTGDLQSNFTREHLTCSSHSVQEHFEEWKQLCVQAAVEHDPKKMLELTKRINELLLDKQKRLDSEPPKQVLDPHRATVLSQSEASN